MELAFKLCTPLFFLFTISIFSQTKWIPQGNGYSYSFDLKYSSNTVKSDSSEIINFDLQYGDVVSVYVDTSSNSPADSVGIYLGGQGFASYGAAANDTIWGGLATVRDSAWDVGNVLIANTTGTHYTLSEFDLDLAKFTLMNYRGELPDRQIKLILKIKKSITVTQ